MTPARFKAIKKLVRAARKKPRPKPPEPEPVKLPDLSQRCDHGKHHGEVCYKCDPKFGYPMLPEANAG